MLGTLAEVVKSSSIISKNISFSESFEMYINSLDIRESSKDTYKRRLKVFFEWMKKVKLFIPTKESILRYKEFLNSERKVTILTLSGYLASLNCYFKWLEEEDLYPNIMKRIKLPKRRQEFRKDALTLDQARLLLSSIERSSLTGKRDYAIVNLMIRTGLRTIEIIRADQEDIANSHDEQILFIQGKGRDYKDNFVVLTPSTNNAIQEYLLQRKFTSHKEPIFVSHSSKNYGQRLTTRSISRIVKTRLRKINLNSQRLSAHSLRHTAITFSLLGGASPQEAALMARHANINTTLIYAHNINRIKQAPEKRIDAYFD